MTPSEREALANKIERLLLDSETLFREAYNNGVLNAAAVVRGQM